MANTIKIQVLGEVRDINKKLGQVNSQLTGFGKTTKKISGALKLAFGGLIAGKAIDFFKDIVSGSSDAQQSIGGSQAVFGKFADTVISKSNKAANAYGLSANQYRENANLIGALLKNQGVATDKLAGKTDKLVGLGADLAATYGGPTKDAVEALGSAYKGEFDPLEKYGISLKAAQVTAEATTLANKKYGKSLTDLSIKQQNALKRQATTNLIMKQSGDAQGQFAKQTNTLAEQQQILAAKIQNLKDKLGRLFLPILTKAAGYVSDKVVPALDDMVSWLDKNQDKIKDTASAIAGKFLPPVRIAGSVLETVVKTLAKLPAPVKTLGVEVAVSALAVSKLNSAMVAFKSTALFSFVAGLGRAKTATTDLRAATLATEQRMASLKSGLRTVAGIGGMALLADSTQRTSKTMGALEGAAGGALSGGALGAFAGPPGMAIGGAIGGIAGAALGLFSATKKSKDEAKKSIPVFQDYGDTLKGVAGNLTSATRQTVAYNLSQSGTLKAAKELGVNTNDLVGAVLGNAHAQGKVNDQLRAYMRLHPDSVTKGHDKALNNLTKNLGIQQDKLKQDREAFSETQYAAQNFNKTLKGIKPSVRTKIEALGYKPALTAVANLANKYKLTPKQIKTVLRVTGTEGSVKKVKHLQAELKGTGKVKPDFSPWSRKVSGTLNDAERRTRDGSKTINSLLKSTGKTKPSTDSWLGQLSKAYGNGKQKASGTSKDINHSLAKSGDTKVSNSWVGSLSSAIRIAKGIASSGGAEVGSNLASGIKGSFDISGLASAAAAGVRAAVQAAKAAGDIHSPSRKMAKIGRQLAQGLIKGWHDFSHKIATMSAKDVHRLVVNTSKGINKYSSITKHIRNLEKALIRNARARDKNNKKLTKERELLKTLQGNWKSYRQQVQASAQSYGSIVSGNAAFNSNAMINSMQARLDKVRQFNRAIKTLIAQGLNKTTIDDLMQAGVEGGLAYAQALADGGQDAVNQVNSLQAKLNGASKALGTHGADSMYRAGIDAAKGMIKGLQRQGKKLDGIGRRLANTIVKAIRNRLKIHSPSLVFKELGQQTLKGMEIGLQDTTGVKRSMTRLGDVMTNSFDPKLQTYAKSNGSNTHNMTLNVNVPATADKAAIGREISKTLDAYYRQGGRRLATA